MLFKTIYMFLAGYITIIIEGFFVERFLNQCRNKKIVLQNLRRESNTYVKVEILKDDFREIRNIAKNSKCKIKIERKVGIPFFIHRYKKRKVFAIAVLVIAIFIFSITQFIWNVEVIGNQEIESQEILDLINKYGINIGKLKYNIDSEKITNSIRLEMPKIAWIGIEIKGTNAIISVEEATPIPEIIDKTEICNIVATKDAIISKIVVQSGTARVNVGDEVKQGDLLVEGVMEGQYTGTRFVHSEADIMGKFYYQKEKFETFEQYQKIETGNREEKKEIYLNNFKINFNKGVSKFENYDTISSSKKIKLFSDFYLPIEIKNNTNIEFVKETKSYSEEELKDKIINELEKELESEYKLSQYIDEFKKREVIVNKEKDGLAIKLIYEVQEEIGRKENLN